MTMIDEHSNFDAKVAIAPASADSAEHTVTGNVIDLQGYNSCVFLVELGALAAGGSGTYKIYHDDAVGMGTEAEATLANGDLSNAPVAITDAMDNTVHQLAYVGNKRYVRIKLTTVGAFAKAYASTAILGHKRH